MIFTILITIVFISEIIITIAIINGLIKLDKAILDLNNTVELAKPGVKDISELVHKISEQMVELTEDSVADFKDTQEKFALKQLTKLLGALLLWKFNSKLINRIRKSKITKLLGKGLSLLEIVV